MAQEEYLEHYGVKGMKWGVRKAKRQEKRSVTKKTNRKYDEKNDQAKKEFANNVSEIRKSNKNVVRKGAAIVKQFMILDNEISNNEADRIIEKYGNSRKEYRQNKKAAKNS